MENPIKMDGLGVPLVSETSIYFLLGSSSVKLWNEPLTFTFFFIQKRTWFFKTQQNQDVGYKSTFCHEIHVSSCEFKPNTKVRLTENKREWAVCKQLCLYLERQKSSKWKIHPPSLWFFHPNLGYFTQIPPLHPTTTTHTQPHKTQGIVGCTPTNVPLLGLGNPSKKPYI